MNTQQEHEVYRFFEGLDAGVKSLCQVRTLYDEQVAFEFNSTRLFWPNENKTSEILAFFLDPNQTHGQKRKFLDLFIEKFEIKVPSLLSENIKTIDVQTEDPTNENRRIDVTIRFGKGEYVIGIENKIGSADQKKQLTDYAKELNRRTGSDAKWILFYLTPDGNVPSENSIERKDRECLMKSGNLKLISYSNDIIELFEQFEVACKAESVRAFLKDFRHYLKQQYIGGTIMGEIELTESFIKDNPKIVLLIGNVCRAISNLYQSFRDDFLVELCKELKAEGLDLIDPSLWSKGWDPTRYFYARFDKNHDIIIDEKPLGFRLTWTGWTDSPHLLIGLGPEYGCDFEIVQQKLDAAKASLASHFHGDVVAIDGNNLSLGWVILVNGFMTNEYMALNCKRPMTEIAAPIVTKIKEYINTCDRLLKNER